MRNAKHFAWSDASGVTSLDSASEFGRRPARKFDAAMRPAGWRAAIACGSVASFASAAAPVPAGLTTGSNGTYVYTQDFNTLASSGTSSTVPAGVGFVESGSNANATYTAGTGSSTAGETYSLGIAGAGVVGDRALGGLQSGSLMPTLGVAAKNDSGMSLISVTVSYTGEQWRLGTAGRADRLDFQYFVTPTSATLDSTTFLSTAFLDRDALDFSSPKTTGTVGALDGNLAANRTAITNTFMLNVPVSSNVYFRWLDADATGADDILAVDDLMVSFTPLAAPEPTTAALGLLGGSVVLTRRRKRVTAATPAVA